MRLVFLARRPHTSRGQRDDPLSPRRRDPHEARRTAWRRHDVAGTAGKPRERVTGHRRIEVDHFTVVEIGVDTAHESDDRHFVRHRLRDEGEQGALASLEIRALGQRPARPVERRADRGDVTALLERPQHDLGG